LRDCLLRLLENSRKLSNKYRDLLNSNVLLTEWGFWSNCNEILMILVICVIYGSRSTVGQVQEDNLWSELCDSGKRYYKVRGNWFNLCGLYGKKDL